MIRSGKIRKSVLFLVAILLLGSMIAFSYHRDRITCMGVEILTEADMDKFTEYSHLDVSKSLLFNGEPAAVDLRTNTLYIPVNPDTSMQAKDLAGKLSTSDRRYTVYFAPDEYFSDLASAIRTCHSFTLLISGNDATTSYNVIFTTLPVLSLEGEITHANEEGRDVAEGKICLWTSNDPDTGRYSVKHAQAHWHIRGGTTSSMPKVSWKLSLKDKHGDNENLSFLGMGADDDWILNAMYLDDTKQKEKLFMDLWNHLAPTTTWNLKMSTGEYVEIVINGEYMGVYLLQRRVDEKYLELDDEDILLKGKKTRTASVPQDAYEIISTALSADETYALMDRYFFQRDYSNLKIDNYIDMNLLLRYANAMDNNSYKNMFYVLKKEGNDYSLAMIPWDTDMSWGIGWDERFVYSYDLVNGLYFERTEFSYVKQHYPDIERKMASRWFELRKGLLSEETIISMLQSTNRLLSDSGVKTREYEKWGSYYDGEDSFENLRNFLKERLLIMDRFYGS